MGLGRSRVISASYVRPTSSFLFVSGLTTKLGHLTPDQNISQLDSDSCSRSKMYTISQAQKFARFIFLLQSFPWKIDIKRFETVLGFSWVFGGRIGKMEWFFLYGVEKRLMTLRTHTLCFEPGDKPLPLGPETTWLKSYCDGIKDPSKVDRVGANVKKNLWNLLCYCCKAQRRKTKPKISLKLLAVCIPVTTITYFNRKSGSLWVRVHWTICKNFSGFSLTSCGVFNTQELELHFLTIFQAM